MAYAERVLDYYDNPRNVGTLDKTSARVGTGLIHVPEYIEVVRIQIEVSPARQIIMDARFKTFGCGAAIAATSITTEWLKGKSIEEAARLDHMDIVEVLNLPPAKIHCTILIEDAVKAAINDYRHKNGMEQLKEEEEEEEEAERDYELEEEHN
ncbi:iron-sulfur cluster assembly scaffold protein [Chitinophaga filiformis]|uniref:iron-sulfur cluster assembly scaffold protein n=1 Tax=Chitinophaga filiformis TaxID=104663 RepID=UPI001F20F068|nr:iron-sulfur cluster assembly scaffold protein [Chitinophaga filiformis]MCF6401419.1 iron-sulfur cluster assembly scaffold protein [Chitinophaga filiformis]